jgi:hypothetical protein
VVGEYIYRVGKEARSYYQQTDVYYTYVVGDILMDEDPFACLLGSLNPPPGISEGLSFGFRIFWNKL